MDSSKLPPTKHQESIFAKILSLYDFAEEMVASVYNSETHTQNTTAYAKAIMPLVERVRILADSLSDEYVNYIKYGVVKKADREYRLVSLIQACAKEIKAVVADA